jgi:hypothetical protein
VALRDGGETRWHCGTEGRQGGGGVPVLDMMREALRWSGFGGRRGLTDKRAAGGGWAARLHIDGDRGCGWDKTGTRLGLSSGGERETWAVGSVSLAKRSLVLSCSSTLQSCNQE